MKIKKEVILFFIRSTVHFLVRDKSLSNLHDSFPNHPVFYNMKNPENLLKCDCLGATSL